MSSYAIRALAKKYNVDYDAALNYADYVVLRMSSAPPGVWHKKAIDVLEASRHNDIALDQDDFIKELLAMRGQRG